MVRLRKKVWEIKSTEEKDIDAEIQTNEHELIDLNRDLVKIETNIVLMKKKRVNETSVSV
jgi:hypothetical protein